MIRLSGQELAPVLEVEGEICPILVPTNCLGLAKLEKKNAGLNSVDL